MSSDSQVPDSEPEFPSPNDNRASHQITKGSTFVSTTGTNIAIGVCGAIAALLAARVLGPQGRGELAAIQVWPTFLQVIAAAGMSEAISYFCARSPHQARQYLSTGLLISLSSASAFMIVGYFFLPIALHSKGPGVVHDAQAMLLILSLIHI